MANDFDPAKYLAEKTGQKSFDPKDYLKSKIGYQGPPDVGLEQVIPTDIANKYAGFAADKLRESTQGKSIPIRAASHLGALGLDIAGGLAPSSGKDLAVLMSGGPLMREVTPVVKSAAPHVGDALADLAGWWTGKEPEYIKTLFKNPQIMRKVSDAIGMDIQKSAVDSINSAKQQLGSKIRALQDSLAQFGSDAVSGKAPMVETKGALKTIASELEARGHRIAKGLGGRDIALKVPRLDPEDPGYKLVTRFMGKMNQDLDFGEALNMKRQLDDIIHYGAPGNNGLQKVTGEADSALRLIRRNLNKSMGDSLKGNPQARKEWVLANKAYEDGSRAFDELSKQVIGQNPHQTAMRVARNFRNRTSDEMFTKAQKLSKEASDSIEEIRDRVVAAQFKRWIGGMNAGQFLPASPRAVGYATAGLGKVLPATGNAIASNPQTIAAMINSLRNSGQQ